LQGIFPEETGDHIKSKTIKFCHIDVDTYQSAKDTFKYIWPKMANNGIIIFDDYGTQGLEGITRVCNEIKEYQDCLSFHMFNGQFMVIKASVRTRMLRRLLSRFVGLCRRSILKNA
jgi:O-methyltransferase